MLRPSNSGCVEERVLLDMLQNKDRVPLDKVQDKYKRVVMLSSSGDVVRGGTLTAINTPGSLP